MWIYMVSGNEPEEETNMPEQKSQLLTNFIVRAIIGDFCAGGAESMDGFDIRNPWNSWGCAPLWNFFLWNYVKIAQSFGFSGNGIDKWIKRGL